MQIKVFGTLEISHDGDAITVGRQKCRGLLAVLVSSHPHGMTLEALGHALWPDADSQQSTNSVRVHISHLRRYFGPQSGVIARGAGRYSVAMDRIGIDVAQFEDLSREARALVTSGNPRAACDVFERAVALWNGEPYEEFRDIDALRGEFVRLDALCLDTLEGYATALLDDDRADEACRLLEPPIERHLIREALAARLMLALYRTGRQQDALALFGRVKSALADGLGLLPSASLQSLADAIVLQRGELDLAPIPQTVDRSSAVRTSPEPFIGRETASLALAETWGNAGAGRPQLATVEGAAGIGKSMLVARFVDQIQRDGFTVVAGRCDPDPTDPYQPFPELVRNMLALAPPTDTSPTLIGELRHLVPDLAPQLPPVPEPAEPSAGRHRLFAAVAMLLANPDQPRLLLIEDLHWARPDALLLLRHILREASGQLMVLATVRHDEVSGDPARRESLFDGLLGHPDCVITLETMTRHEIAALIRAVAPAGQRGNWLEHVDELADVSAGNPLRVREVLRQLALEPTAAISEIVPDDVRTLVARRVRALDEDARIVVQTAAVFGRTFSLPQVALATDLSESQVLDALEQASDVGLVTEDVHVDDFTFAHPMFRNAVYHGLTHSRRVRRHIACADVLAAQIDRDGTSGLWTDAARHLISARPVSDAGRTATFAARAGEAAADRYAHGEAAVWFRHAVECAEASEASERDVAYLRIALGKALENSGELDAARIEFFLVADIARARSDAQLLADTVVAATPRESVIDTEVTPRLAALIDEALTAVNADDPSRIRLLRSAVLTRLYSDPDSVDALAREAAHLSSSCEDPQLRHWALTLSFFEHDVQADSQRRLATTRAIRNNSASHDLVQDVGGDTRRLLVELLVQGELDEFDRELEELHRTAQRTSIPSDIYWASALLATRTMMDRCSSDVEELVKAAGLRGKHLQVFASGGTQVLQMFALRYQQGRVREMTAGLSVPAPSSPKILAGSSLLALSFCEADRHSEAAALLDRAITDDEVLLPPDNFRNAAVALFGGVAAQCGRRSQRALIRRELERRVDEFCVFGAGGAVFGTSHHWLARLDAADGDETGSADHLRAAIGLCQYSGATFWADAARQALTASHRHIRQDAVTHRDQ